MNRFLEAAARVGVAPRVVEPRMGLEVEVP